MAEIPVEKKSNMAWLWILLALLLAALLIWWALDVDDAAPVVAGAPAPAVPSATAAAESPQLPEPVAQSSGRSIADIIANPAAFVGQTFSDDSVAVAGVPTDRGFWIGDSGARLFALLIEARPESPKDINPGQTLRIREGMLRDATSLQQGQIPGALDPDTRKILQEQKIFLVVDEKNVEIMPGAAGATSADAATSAQGQ